MLGLGLPLEQHGMKLGYRSTLFEAQVDEQIAKSLIAQKELVKFCRELKQYIHGSVYVDPGIKNARTSSKKYVFEARKSLRSTM